MALLSTDMIEDIRKVAEEYSRREIARRKAVAEEYKKRRQENPFAFTDEPRFEFWYD